MPGFRVCNEFSCLLAVFNHDDDDEGAGDARMDPGVAIEKSE